MWRVSNSSSSVLRTILEEKGDFYLYLKGSRDFSLSLLDSRKRGYAVSESLYSLSLMQ